MGESRGLKAANISGSRGLRAEGRGLKAANMGDLPWGSDILKVFPYEGDLWSLGLLTIKSGEQG